MCHFFLFRFRSVRHRKQFRGGGVPQSSRMVFLRRALIVCDHFLLSDSVLGGCDDTKSFFRAIWIFFVSFLIRSLSVETSKTARGMFIFHPAN